MLKVAGPDVETIANMIEECEGLGKIEDLQNHENVEIYKLAYDIIEHFFSDSVSCCNNKGLINTLILFSRHSSLMLLTWLQLQMRQASNSLKAPTCQTMHLSFK